MDRDLSVGPAFLTNLALRSHLVKGWMCYPLDKSLSIEWITQLIFGDTYTPDSDLFFGYYIPTFEQLGSDS